MFVTRIRNILIFLLLTILCIYFAITVSVNLNKKSERELNQTSYRVSEYLHLASEFANDISEVCYSYFKVENPGIDKNMEDLVYSKNFYFETSDEILKVNRKLLGRGSEYTVERDKRYINLAFVLDTFFEDFTNGFDQITGISYYSKHNYAYTYSIIGSEYLKNLGFYEIRNKNEEVLKQIRDTNDVYWESIINKNYISQKEIILNVPIYEEENIEGIINIHYSIEFINDILKNSIYQIYLIDKDGYIISSNNDNADNFDHFSNIKEKELFGERKGQDIIDSAFNLEDNAITRSDLFKIATVIPDNFAMVLYVPRYTYFISILSSILSIAVIGKIIFWLSDTLDRSRVIRYELSEKYDEVSKLKVELEQIAITDFLTKLYNRRYMLEKIEETRIYYSDNLETSFAVLMMDIDHFKVVNDTYGHAIGDEVLIEISKTILNNVRKGDLVARWGGEEILVVLTDISKEESLLVAEKIRDKVSETVTKVDKLEIKVTVSIGGEMLKIDESFDKVLTHADSALYQAKDTGRNKVVFYKNDTE